MARSSLALKLKDHLEEFLDLWVQAMADAGYLQDTTAKREDCIRSYWGFLDPVLDYLQKNAVLPGYPEMLENKNNWAGNLIQFAQRHRARGITVDMFQGCFKTLVHCLETMITRMEGSDLEKLKAIAMIRRWADGAEILMLADWKMMGQLEAVERLAETNRELTLEKNKYENILEATSDMVLVTDPEGIVTEANAEAKVVLQGRDILGRFSGEVLGLGENSMGDMLSHFPLNTCHEIRLKKETAVYNLRIIPLQTVSLASRGYMIMLSDISLLVKQRELLQKEVKERTSALEELNITLRNVLQSINEKNSEYKQEIFQTIQDSILPALEKIERESDSGVRNNYLNLVKDQLMRLTGEMSTDTDMHLLKLSPTELKVCQFIQAGNGTKDIAETLGLSVETVQTHRKNIRKKLGLRGRDITLFNYLNAPALSNLVDSEVS